MAVIRVFKPESNFTMISNKVIRSSSLSFRAVGLYAYLLSLPPGAETTMAYLAKAKAEGVAALRAARNELTEAGYLAVVEDKRGGRFAGATWCLAIEPWEFPELLPGMIAPKCENHGLPACGFSPAVESPAGQSSAVDRTHNKNSDLKTEKLEDQDQCGLAEEVQAAWNEAAKKHGFQSVRSMKARLPELRARSKDKDWLEGWRAAVAQVAAARWRLGDNQRAWKANIDWFLRPKTVFSLLEERDSMGAGKPAGAVRTEDREAFRL